MSEPTIPAEPGRSTLVSFKVNGREVSWPTPVKAVVGGIVALFALAMVSLVVGAPAWLLILAVTR